MSAGPDRPEAGPSVPDSASAPRGRPPGPAWHRAASGRYLGGVAAGLARGLDVDPFVVRLALAVAGLLWPLVVLPYALAWLLVPSDEEARPLALRVHRPGALREVLGAVALTVGGLVLLPDLGPDGSTSLQVGVALVAAGLLLLIRPREARPDRGGGPGPTPGGGDVDPDAPGWLSAGRARPPVPPGLRAGVGAAPAPRWLPGWAGAAWAERPTLWSSVAARRAQRPPRTGPRLTPVVLSLLVLLVGGVAAVEQVDGYRTPPGVVVAWALVLVGGALVLSAWWGRARGLLVLVPPLVVGWVAFSLSDIPWYPGTGARTEVYDPGGPAAAARYRHGVGSLTLDLRNLPADHVTPVPVEAAVTAGRLRVVVPADARLEVAGHVGLGQVEVWDGRTFGPYRMYDSGPVANREVGGTWGPLAPRCWPVPVEGDWDGDGHPDEGSPAWTEPRPGGPPPTTTAPLYQTPEGESCDPDAPVPDGGLVRLSLAAGAGTIEVHRVDPLS